MFEGGLTYSKGVSWISQLDWALVSKPSLKHVRDFKIIHNIPIPTDHAAVVVKLGGLSCSPTMLVERAKQLGESHMKERSNMKQPIQFYRIGPGKVYSNPPETTELWKISDPGLLCNEIAERLYCTAKAAKLPRQQSTTFTPTTTHQRWQFLLKNGDAKQIWRAIGWHGSFDVPHDKKNMPSDREFCAYYESLLQDNGNVTGNISEFEPSKNIYIPVLDDPISPCEVENAIKCLKQNKAPGTDGVPPGILKLLSDDWTLLLTHLFNHIFSSGYPTEWTYARVFSIFKKGSRLSPENYRGISIMNALSKLYDIVLSKRLILWYTPTEEQAGAQKGKGCEQQILIIRLLIDIARKCARKLYLVFVDYQKAYDKVPRLKLLQQLDLKGCGTKFLKAIASCMASTRGAIGDELFWATMGVRQGAPTSCPLFTFYLDETVDAINQCGEDGWLGAINCLLLMDDTVILATSREKMMDKLCALKRSCDDIGMKIHPAKSQFICVNDNDSLPFVVGDITIAHTKSYVYLGTPITASSIKQQVDMHLSSEVNHSFKFTSLLGKNNDAIFPIKLTLWESALKSALFYSSKTWLTDDLRPAESVYMNSLKSLLGVRKSTCHDLVLIELGMGDAKSYVRQRQANFLHKLKAGAGYNNSIIAKVITMAIDSHTSSGKLLKVILENGPSYDYAGCSLQRLKRKVQESTSTRRRTYLSLNPLLTSPASYGKESSVKEYQRTSFTRLRLSSHRLRIETGRWSRIAPDQRLCNCGEIQTEDHVLFHCPATANIRLTYHMNSQETFHSIMSSRDISEICAFCHDTLTVFAN